MILLGLVVPSAAACGGAHAGRAADTLLGEENNGKQ